ncbi:PREDICTED: uncharacterized protein LOC108574500, partial [Habropoda laboriosa]|uniref:uncharacterized protein LOC108574500 n=1 Tax=Habropoda laboriosa TaxID=597456 RepID=UPI00083D278D
INLTVISPPLRHLQKNYLYHIMCPFIPNNFSIFQRTSVSRGQLRIQGVATCLYLCMDSCGLLYGSTNLTENDCVFNETLEQHNYNTYTSVKWSTTKKSLYLGLNGRGQPRRVQARGHNLGRLSAYVRVLTQVAPLERVEALQRRMLGAQHNVRHRHNNHRGDMIQQSLCPTLPVQEKDGRDKFRCRKRKKRKKRKRRCRPGERPGPQCQMAEENGSTVVLGRNESLASNGTSPESKRSCEGAASEEACRREALSVPSKKRKLRVEEPAEGGGATTAGSRNVTASSNGKSKAPASNAKKVNAAGSMSQSKKPNLTDGKKKKKKGPAARRNSAVPLARKRFTPGRTDNTSAVPTATSVPTSVTSSSSWWSPGASTGPSGRGNSPRRRTKQSSSSRNVGSNNARTIGPPQSVTVKVPDTVSDRSVRDSSPSSVELSDITEEDTSKLLSESLSNDEDPSSTFSNEHATATINSMFGSSSIETGAASTMLRLFEEENKSVEEIDDADDSDRFDIPETIQSTTPGILLERLAM